jgi:hypothetical protein
MSVLVKECWVGPREQVLNVLITCWDPWIGQPMCCGSGWEPFFSGAVTLSNSVGSAQKVVMYGLS